MTHPAPPPRDYRPLDAALARLRPKGQTLRNGFTSHAPMVVEALCALNRPQAVGPWLDANLADILDRPAPTRPISPQDWGSALGQLDRFEDWALWFYQALVDTPWPQVLGLWSQRLAPGFCAAATHGLLRTAHAARALGQDTTAPRLYELADALASWASTYQTLPASGDQRSKALPPKEAILEVRRLPVDMQTEVHAITDGLAQLINCPDFGGEMGLLDISGDLPRLWDDLAQTMACLYLTNAKDAFSHIVFVHAVTSLEAARGLAYHLEDQDARQLALYAWQTACGLYVRFGTEAPARARDLRLDATPQILETMIDDAVATGDDHLIKLTEACLRAHTHRPSPAHLLAVQKAQLLVQEFQAL